MDDDGAAAFDRAGSLCHGWSAIPVWFYHRYVLGELTDGTTVEPVDCGIAGAHRDLAE